MTQQNESVCKFSMQVLGTLLCHPKTRLGPVDSHGHTPLWDAMVMGDHAIAGMLRVKGAPVQPNIAMQLCKAASQNNVTFIELLLMHNVNILAQVWVVELLVFNPDVSTAPSCSF